MERRASALGDYLRARREQVRPEDVGLVAGKRRRVAGLRREELATLGGISSAYYLRLEQSRVTTLRISGGCARAGPAARRRGDGIPAPVDKSDRQPPARRLWRQLPTGWIK